MYRHLAQKLQIIYNIYTIQANNIYNSYNKLRLDCKHLPITVAKMIKKPAIRGNYCISSNSILLLNPKLSKILITLLQKNTEVHYIYRKKSQNRSKTKSLYKKVI